MQVKLGGTRTLVGVPMLSGSGLVGRGLQGVSDATFLLLRGERSGRAFHSWRRTAASRFPAEP